MSQSFHLAKPVNATTSVVFASPHSGRHYPLEFTEKSCLGPIAIRRSEDAFVDELYGNVTQFGAPLLSAVLPRAFLDLNRSADELDPALIDGAPISPLNPRIASGLGVIPRVVAEGKAIQFGKITMEEAKKRLALYYRPYHTQLQIVLEGTRKSFGQAILIDCHSMPSDALKTTERRTSIRSDIILGNRFGASCSAEIMNALEDLFSAEGFNVARNVPFAGAYIVQTYGRPSINQHAVQVEIDRSLYMDEDAVVKLPEFTDIQNRLTKVAEGICDFGRLDLPMAAQ
jgi:N-formylglutamate deformylase